MAKKTTAKKKTPKKKKAAPRKRPLTFRCRGGCTPTPPQRKVNLGDTVVMKAVGTNVKVTFTTSPFTKKVFNIVPGAPQPAKAVRKGTFSYSLKCDACPAGAIPPQIIVN